MDYESYLKVSEILDLQQPLSDGPEHDELLFITIHQVYELWFKLILHEADSLAASLERGDGVAAMAALKRVRTVMKTLVSQIDILETMTPLSFSSFRDRLDRASGFQSAQFRELEVLLGARDPRKIAGLHPDSRALPRLKRRLEEPSIYDSFVAFLSTRGYLVPPSAKRESFLESVAPNLELQEILIAIYRNDSETSQLCELLVDLDEGLQEWRYRHVKMVERTIGVKMGTGGSSGSEYLRSTLFQPVFPDLWAIRSRM